MLVAEAAAVAAARREPVLHRQVPPRSSASRSAPGPSEGSSVEHLAFKVKSLKDTLAKLDATGTKPMAGATATQAFVLAPNGVKVQLVEDTALATPIASYEMLMKVSSVADASAWYEKWFGARIVKQGQSTVAEIPGHEHSLCGDQGSGFRDAGTRNQPHRA